jgi:hypothetical protein
MLGIFAAAMYSAGENVELESYILALWSQGGILEGFGSPPVQCRANKTRLEKVKGGLMTPAPNQSVPAGDHRWRGRRSPHSPFALDCILRRRESDKSRIPLPAGQSTPLSMADLSPSPGTKQGAYVNDGRLLTPREHCC